MQGKLVKIWIVTAILSFVIENGLGLLLKTTMDNNGLVPWRQPDANGWLLLAVVSIAGGLAFAYIFLQGYNGRGWMEGVRFGLWITLLASVPYNLGYAALLPLGRRLPIEFILQDLVTFVVCGAVAASIAGSAAMAGRAAGA